MRRAVRRRDGTAGFTAAADASRRAQVADQWEGHAQSARHRPFISLHGRSLSRAAALFLE